MCRDEKSPDFFFTSILYPPIPVLPGDENFSAISAKDQYSEQLELCNTQPGHPEEVKMLVSDTPRKINGWNPQNCGVF